MNDEQIILIILAVIFVVPIMAAVVSFCSYVGKAWAIRFLFKNKKGGNQ